MLQSNLKYNYNLKKDSEYQAYMGAPQALRRYSGEESRRDGDFPNRGRKVIAFFSYGSSLLACIVPREAKAR